MRIYLCGVPNTGKTTLFNALTGAREATGNRAGVTVDAAARRMKTGDTLFDLPGIAGLTYGSEEERIARETIERDPPDLLIEVVDATNPVRGLALYRWLAAFGVPIVVALNCMDEVRRLRRTVDIKRLQRRLGCPVVPISARKRQGIKELLEAIRRRPAGRRNALPDAKERIRFAEEIAAVCFTEGGARKRIDAVLTHPILGIPLFFSLLIGLFWLAFDGVGPWLSDGIAGMIDGLGNWIETLPLPPLLYDLVRNGVVNGVGQVLTFLPQIALLTGCLSLLEDSGYLARAAFLFDRAFARIGLNGTAVIPLLLGFGCTVPAALCVRTQKRVEDRRRILRLLPMVPCSAKLPVLSLLVAQTFPAHRAGGMLLLYLGSVLLALPHAVCGKSKNDEPLLLELPPYRAPNAQNTIRLVGDRMGHFLFRAGVLILLCQVGLWALSRLTADFALSDRPQDSLLFWLGARIAPLFAPLGFSDVGAVVALLNGVFAKEAAAAALSLFSVRFTPSGAIGFAVFLLLSPPCVAALSAIRKEYGTGYWKTVVLQLLYAYGVAAAACMLTRLLIAG